MVADVASVIDAHRAAGSFFDVGGIRSFMRTEGEGEPVVLVHGLPASSFLYRKVIAELAGRGLRAVAFDLPGLGLADRPTDFDYTLSGLGVFVAAAIDSLGIDRFHLVVHDAGGPIGFEAASRLSDRVQSLTMLNTIPQIDSTPFPGEFLARFTRKVGGPMTSAALWRRMMYRVGILDRSAVPEAEVDAYRDLALGPDAGAAYLQIMRGLHATRGETKDYRPAAARRLRAVSGADRVGREGPDPDHEALRLARPGGDRSPLDVDRPGTPLPPGRPGAGHLGVDRPSRGSRVRVTGESPR